MVLDRKNDKSCDTGLFELIYRQPPITDPLQLETNLCVEGRKVLPWVTCRLTVLLIGLFRCLHFNHCICTGYVLRVCTPAEFLCHNFTASWLLKGRVTFNINICVINCDICIVFLHIFLGLFNKLYVFLLQVEQTIYVEVCFYGSLSQVCDVFQRQIFQGQGL